ncbi:MAG: hypothetical protein V4531_05585 [Actinomycetota bacterium]
MTYSSQLDAEQFNEAVRKYFSDPDRIHGEHVSIVGTRITDDGAAVAVVFREYDHGPVLGVHVDLHSFCALFDPGSTAAYLANVVASDLIADPSGGAGAQMEVPWADGLVPNPGEVRWRLL